MQDDASTFRPYLLTVIIIVRLNYLIFILPYQICQQATLLQVENNFENSMSNSLFKDRQKSRAQIKYQNVSGQFQDHDCQQRDFMFSTNKNSRKYYFLKLLAVIVLLAVTTAFLFITDTLTNYPLHGKKWVSTNLFQSNKLNQHNLQVQTLQIAKQYLKIGLQQPQAWLVQKQKDYYQRKYHLQQIFTDYLKRFELPFCIVIPSYNNAENKRYLLPLVSVFRQNYSNYRVIYIDDASTDGTADLVLEFKKSKELSDDKMKVIKNTQNKGPLQNQYQTGLNQCGQQQIYVLIDGDDGLIGKQTLKLLNHFYQTSNTWFVYSNYIDSRSQAFGISNKIPDYFLQTHSYRNNVQTWVTSHLKSFYNKLLHSMNKSNLMDRDSNGKQTHIFKVNADRAIAYPIVEMSGNRVSYVPQILYIYLSLTPNTEGVKNFYQQNRTLYQMKNYPKQKQLQMLFQNDKCLQPRVYLRQRLSKGQVNKDLKNKD